jgi:hypothetical protein
MVGRLCLESHGARLVAWRGDTPVVVTGNRLLLLAEAPQVLLSAPPGIRELEIATDRIGEPPHRLGRPQPGPFVQRYPLVTALGALASLAALVLIVRRRRRKRL